MSGMHGPLPGLGSIEVICGSMFSGKSEELIRRVRRALLARQRVQVFKPRLDDRYSSSHVVSHSDMSVPAQLVENAEEILRQVDDRTEVIAVDEVQFFDAAIVDVCEKLANMGRRVIAAGLDQDYRGQPFEPVPQLMAVAEYVTKTLAVCSRCGAPANRTQRLIDSADRIVVGAVGAYEARCRRCFEAAPERQIAIPLAKPGSPGASAPSAGASTPED